MHVILEVWAFVFLGMLLYGRFLGMFCAIQIPRDPPLLDSYPMFNDRRGFSYGHPLSTALSWAHGPVGLDLFAFGRRANTPKRPHMDTPKRPHMVHTNDNADASRELQSWRRHWLSLCHFGSATFHMQAFAVLGSSRVASDFSFCALLPTSLFLVLESLPCSRR